MTTLLTNPLTNTLALPLGILLLVMFGGAALLLEVAHLRRVALLHRGGALPARATPEKVLWQRYLTWAIIAPLFVGAALAGPLAVAALCAYLCWQGAQEYAALTGLTPAQRWLLILAGWGALAAVLIFGLAALLVAPVIAFFGWALLALCPSGLEAELDRRFLTPVLGFWGFLYLGWLPAHLILLSASKAPALVLLVGLGVALSDVGAFCAGKLLGGPKLAPRLSPGKTWGGVLGNLLGAALALALIQFALPPLRLWQAGLIVLAIGLGSVWGDLLESLLKRQRGVKDAGGLLPGFGGLLDRIDSLLIAAPLVYYLALLLIH